MIGCIFNEMNQILLNFEKNIWGPSTNSVFGVRVMSINYYQIAIFWNFWRSQTFILGNKRQNYGHIEYLESIQAI